MTNQGNTRQQHAAVRCNTLERGFDARLCRAWETKHIQSSIHSFFLSFFLSFFSSYVGYLAQKMYSLKKIAENTSGGCSRCVHTAPKGETCCQLNEASHLSRACTGWWTPSWGCLSLAGFFSQKRCSSRTQPKKKIDVKWSPKFVILTRRDNAAKTHSMTCV